MNYSLQINPDQKIVIVFIKDFVWTNDHFQRVFHNLPEKNRLYLAVKEIPTNAYYVKVDLPGEQNIKGIRIPKSTFKCSDWHAEIVEVDESNVLDLDIHEDDFIHMKGWMESEFADFRKMTDQYISTIVPDPENLPPATDLVQSAYDALDRIQQIAEGRRRDTTKLLEYIFEQDAVVSDALLDFLTAFTKKMKTDHPRLFDYPREIALDSEFGKGANLYSMAFHLQKYTHPAEGFGNVKEDLYAVIYYALLELSRRKMNDE